MAGGDMLRLMAIIGVISGSGAISFDYYTFAQTWPVTTCEDAPSYDDCAIPSNVTGWIIHGLWPSNSQGSDPFYCDDSYPFSTSEIQPLLPNMTVYWTNLYTSSAWDSFWDHEWTKHGTCCIGAPGITDEFDYFNQGLENHFSFQVGHMLNASGIVPSDTASYDLSDFYNAVKAVTGKTPEINCAWDKTRYQQLVYTVEICLDLAFAPIDCPGSTAAAAAGLGYTETCHTTGLLYPRTI